MFKPREYQVSGVNSILEKFQTHNKILYTLPTGGGKCHAVDTEILMYDGSIKKVQDIKVNDQLMGDDSKPRNVLSLARGREKMFKITLTKGDSYIVNESHILSLKVTGIKQGLKYNNKRYFKGDVIDISIKDYLKKSKSFKHCTKSYRVGVDFNEKDLPVDPYYLGLWLGDGTSNLDAGVSIESMDKEVISYIYEYAEKLDLKVSKNEQKKSKSDSYRIVNKKILGCKKDKKHLKYKLELLDLKNNKHIPLIYKTASKKQRLKLLAGLIDSDGSKHRTSYDFIFKSKKLAEDIQYLVRSLGFSCNLKESIKTWTYKNEKKSGLYYRLSCNGDFTECPIKVERQKPVERKQIKDVLVEGFTIEELKEDDYYGFTLDGNHRYLMANFIVTHNTFCFTVLSKKWVEEKKQKVLVLCHRDKLLRQTIKSMNNVGLTCESITRKVKKLKHHADVYVGMIETVNNRLKKNPYFFKNIGLVICDECHILIFNKVFDYFKGVKILGCTATPVVLKRETFYRCHRCMSDYDYEGECCGIETDEYSKPFAMSQIYDDIVIGPSIDWLIENGYLVREFSFVENYTDNSSLKTDKDGEFTTKSIDETYGSGSAVFNVILNYEKLCAGKKTMIFNSSTKVNKKIYEKFLESGYENVRMYDSVNKEESGDQDEVITWFENTPGSVLLNCGVFTTGTDVVDIEAIILNRPTNSLSLYLQMVGRGGRITDKIFKDSFIVIDGGGNIDRHLEWSDPTRDWERIFWEGIGEERQKIMNVMDVQDCENCGALFPKGVKECPECGHEMQRKKEKAPKVLSDEILEPIRKIPPPNAEKIYQYTVRKEENINFAFKILIGKIVDMFIFYRVSKESYLSAQKTGELRKKIDNLLYKNYFVLIRKQDIKSGSNRTLDYLRNKVFEKLEKYYF